MAEAQHHWGLFRAADSSDNRFVQAQVGASVAAPIWRVAEWWTSARVTVYLPGEPGARRHWSFSFPEGNAVDVLAHGLANALDRLYGLGARWVGEEGSHAD